MQGKVFTGVITQYGRSVSSVRVRVSVKIRVRFRFIYVGDTACSNMQPCSLKSTKITDGVGD